MLTLSNTFYKRALKTSEIQSDAEKKERVAITLGLNSYLVKDFAQTIDFLEDYLKEFPSGKYKEIAISELAVSNANLDKIKNAIKYLQLLKTEFPESKNISFINKVIEEAKNKK